jgi:hypothetical protein
MFAAGRPVTAADWALSGKRYRVMIRIQAQFDAGWNLAMTGGAFHVFILHEVESLRARHGTTTITVGRLASHLIRIVNQASALGVVPEFKEWRVILFKLLCIVIAINGLLMIFHGHCPGKAIIEHDSLVS